MTLLCVLFLHWVGECKLVQTHHFGLMILNAQLANVFSYGVILQEVCSFWQACARL
jgi:hypothetical protein